MEQSFSKGAIVASRFRSIGSNVIIAHDAEIDQPEKLEVASNVEFMRGFRMIEGPARAVIGSHVRFYPNCFIQGRASRFIVSDYVDFFPNTYISLGDARGFLEIGHHTHFAPGCALYGHGGLTIGAYCNIAAHTVFATVGHDHAMHGQPMALAPAKMGPITLEDDVWIGANATITANVTIARGCVIGAGAVVTHSTEPNGIYVGVPARRQRDR